MTMSSIERRRYIAPILALLFISFGAGFLLMRQTQAHQSVYDICDLVEEKFYQSDRALTQWAKDCRKSAHKLSIFSSKQEITRLLQDQMDLMHVSHFMIYSPVEDQRLWKGQAVETGLKTRWMEDHLIVFQILAKSPAEKVGFHLGDELELLDGKEIESADVASNHAGTYRVLRDGKEITLIVEAGAIQLDLAPTLTRLDDRTGLIDLSSFRSEYFSDPDWKKFVQGWSQYSRLIFDLRENAGGNLVSMLRALSPLFCKPTVIGDLALPRRGEGDRVALSNDLSDDEQISEIEESPGIALETFSGYGCYSGSVAVLMGSHTSSVSEIFASAMLHRPHSRVLGQPSSGDVVLAVWYDLPSWGPGYSISIPEALYLTPEGKPLEGFGVFPQQEVFDDLKVWRQGRDSWIQSARAANF